MYKLEGVVEVRSFVLLLITLLLLLLLLLDVLRSRLLYVEFSFVWECTLSLAVSKVSCKPHGAGLSLIDHTT